MVGKRAKATEGTVVSREPVHPETGQALDELERCLWRFRMAAHEAKVMWRGFNRVGDVARDINDDLMHGITNQALLIVSKFLEVWDDFGRLSRKHPRVVKARRAIQPAIDRMVVWKGLTGFRNTALAHAYVDRAGKLVPPWAVIRSGEAPTFHAEVVLLMQLVVLASLGVLTAFEERYTPIDPIVRDDQAWIPEPGPGISHGSEIGPELRRIASSLDRGLKEELDVVVGGPLAKTFKKALQAPKRPSRKKRG